MHNLWKNFCVSIECSIADRNEDTFEWEANESVGYCLLCARAVTGAFLNLTILLGFPAMAPCFNLRVSWIFQIQDT